MRFLLIIFSVACNLFIPSIVGFYLGSHKMISKKFVFLGFVQYLLSKVFFVVIVKPFAELKQIQPISLLIIQVVILAIVTVVSKALFYKKVFHANTLQKAISLGYGEGAVEVYFRMLPLAINNLMYYMKIEDGSIFSYFGSTFTESEIVNMIMQFKKNSFSYYIFSGISCALIIILQILLAYLITSDLLHSNSKRLIISLLISQGILSIYYIIPVFNYIIADVLIILCIVVVIIDIILHLNSSRRK